MAGSFIGLNSGTGFSNGAIRDQFIDHKGFDDVVAN